MIVEGLVTSLNVEGTLNIAPMGPHLSDDTPVPFTHLLLKPFTTSRTYHNLVERGEGIFHVTDDVLLLARATLGNVVVPTVPATVVSGQRLVDCCRYYEFRIIERDIQPPRASFRAEVVHSEFVRDFFGFNRAKHAVVEAAILASRVRMLERSAVQAELDRLQPLVAKTAGPQEHAAWNILVSYIESNLPDTPRS